MTDVNIAIQDPTDYRMLSTRQQAALLGRHRDELACLIAPCIIEEQVRDGTGVMIAERDAVVLINPEPGDSAGVRDAYIACVLVRPGMRGKGLGGQVLDAVRARFPDATLSLECFGPRRVAFFERHGFNRTSTTRGGYFWMRSDPGQAQSFADTLNRSTRRARGLGAAADRGRRARAQVNGP
ncbi:GNAT family N-acetyltransferase [Variovorax robiniae]|uniref:GNAT family N-acetyltransferase n=1 Tax=Variovorax robiniae TaxID=1836199 RepID=A0ABU8XK27_9BURK